MDFDFSPEQRAFADEVERFLDEHDDPDVFDVTRENMAQIVDTPKRREFMAKLGEGVGIIGKTILAHGSEKLKKEFLPKILRNEVEFAVGYSEPDARSDAASMKLKAIKDGDGWRLNGQKTWTTSAHFAEWYWVGARTDPNVAKHFGITLFLVPLDDPGITVRGIWTMGDERTNDVFFDDVFVPDD